MGQSIDFFVVHWEKHLSDLHRGSEVDLSLNAGSAACDGDLLTVGESESDGVFRMHFEIAVFRIKFSKDLRLVGPSLSMPLTTCSSTREENKWVVLTGGLG